MIRIFPMTAEQVDAVSALSAQCFSEPWSSALIEAEIQNPRGEILVAEKDGVFAGFVSLSFVLDEGTINNIAVSVEMRRTGIAKALLSEADRFALERGLSFLTLEVRMSNKAAQALYLSHGYESVGVRRGFYQKPTEDALLMTRFYTEERNMI